MVYRPVFCNATPQAEMAPVQLDSVVGEGFWTNGLGIEVDTTQSALPACSALVSSKSTLYDAALALALAFAVTEEAGACGRATAGYGDKNGSRSGERDNSQDCG